jgi:hypothetical protein
VRSGALRSSVCEGEFFFFFSWPRKYPTFCRPPPRQTLRLPSVSDAGCDTAGRILRPGVPINSKLAHFSRPSKHRPCRSYARAQFSRRDAEARSSATVSRRQPTASYSLLAARSSLLAAPFAWRLPTPSYHNRWPNFNGCKTGELGQCEVFSAAAWRRLRRHARLPASTHRPIFGPLGVTIQIYTYRARGSRKLFCRRREEWLSPGVVC